MNSKTSVAGCIAFLIFVTTSSAQNDNLSNLSPEWVRSGARNAAFDAADAVVYNPGGVSRLKSGFHLGVGNQSLFRKPKHEYNYGAGPLKYEQDGNDLLLPSIYASYNKNKWAVFGALYIAGGGGATANFSKGSISTDLMTLLAAYNLAPTGNDSTYGKNASLKATSAYITPTLGFSYSVNETFSFGISARYFIARNKINTKVTIGDITGTYPDIPLEVDIEQKASGADAIFGIDIKPSNKLNFSLRYEMKTKLDFETIQHKDNIGLTTDGEKNRRDFPAVLGFGSAYSFSEKFKVLADFNYSFQTSADWDSTTVLGIRKPLSPLAGKGYNYGIALEYKINPKILVCLGMASANIKFSDQAGYYTILGAFETIPDNNITLHAGAGYNITDKTRINLGFLNAFYKTDKKIKALNYYPLDVDVTVNNTIQVVALGVDFLF